MIDDSMEEGLTEEEAVAKLGTVEEIAAQILSDTSLTTLVKARMKPKRRLRAGEIVLLVLGSPIWLSMMLAAFAVLLALYISLWSVIIALWAIFGALAGCSVGGALACVLFAMDGSGASGLAMLAAGLVCAGLSIFMFCGCRAATKGCLLGTKKMAIRIKRCFVRKEAAK